MGDLEELRISTKKALLALPWNTRSTLTHSPLLALALTRASRPRKKMNSRHKKTGYERPGDNSPVCWPLIETEKQLRQQVTEEHWATNRPRTLGANLHVLASRHDPQVPLGVVVSPLLARTTRPLLCRSCATHTSSSYDSNDAAACGGAISRTHCSGPVDAALHVHDSTLLEQLCGSTHVHASATRTHTDD